MISMTSEAAEMIIGSSSIVAILRAEAEAGDFRNHSKPTGTERPLCERPKPSSGD